MTTIKWTEIKIGERVFTRGENPTQEYFSFADPETGWLWQAIRNKQESWWWAIVMEPDADGRVQMLTSRSRSAGGVVIGPLYGRPNEPGALCSGMVPLIEAGTWPEETTQDEDTPNTYVSGHAVEALADEYDILTLLRAAVHGREMTFAHLAEHILEYDATQAEILADSILLAIGLDIITTTYGWRRVDDDDVEVRRFQSLDALLTRFPFLNQGLAGNQMRIVWNNGVKDFIWVETGAEMP